MCGNVFLVLFMNKRINECMHLGLLALTVEWLAGFSYGRLGDQIVKLERSYDNLNEILWLSSFFFEAAAR